MTLPGKSGRLCFFLALVLMVKACKCPGDDLPANYLRLHISFSSTKHRLEDIKLYWIEDGAPQYDKTTIEYPTTGYDSVRHQWVIDSSKAQLICTSPVWVAARGKTRTFYLDYKGTETDTLNLYVRNVTDGKRCPITSTEIDSIIYRGSKLPLTTDLLPLEVYLLAR